MQILIGDPFGPNRAAAAGLIGAMNPIPVAQVQAPLLILLSHPAAIVAGAALDTLLRFPEPPEQQISQALLGMTGHSDPNQRGLASRGLGQLYEDQLGIDPIVVDTLAAALSDESRMVQWQAANSLRMFGVQAAAAEPDLQAVVWDPKQPPEVREIAQEAVETITSEPITPPWRGQTPAADPGASGAQ